MLNAVIRVFTLAGQNHVLCRNTDSDCAVKKDSKMAGDIKKNPAKQDSPPAAGRVSDILPFRRSAIRAELFYRIETKFPIR